MAESGVGRFCHRFNTRGIHSSAGGTRFARQRHHVNTDPHMLSTLKLEPSARRDHALRMRYSYLGEGWESFLTDAGPVGAILTSKASPPAGTLLRLEWRLQDSDATAAVRLVARVVRPMPAPVTVGRIWAVRVVWVRAVAARLAGLTELLGGELAFGRGTFAPEPHKDGVAYTFDVVQEPASVEVQLQGRIDVVVRTDGVMVPGTLASLTRFQATIDSTRRAPAVGSTVAVRVKVPMASTPIILQGLVVASPDATERRFAIYLSTVGRADLFEHLLHHVQHARPIDA